MASCMLVSCQFLYINARISEAVRPVTFYCEKIYAFYADLSRLSYLCVGGDNVVCHCYLNVSLWTWLHKNKNFERWITRLV